MKPHFTVEEPVIPEHMKVNWKKEQGKVWEREWRDRENQRLFKQMVKVTES